VRPAKALGKREGSLMKALIVYAHPEPQSFNNAMKVCAEETLRSMGWEVVVSDLYAQNFKAVADGDDFKERTDPSFLKYAAEQTHASSDGKGFSDDVAAEIQKLKSADLLILQFPMWWFGFPAILKGWVDRVFAAGTIYGGDIGMFSEGLFRGKRALVAFTSGATKETYSGVGLYGRADVTLWPIENGVLNFAGFSVLPHFQAEAPAKLDDAGRKAILDDWESYLRSIESHTPLDFHDLEDFDRSKAWTLRPGVKGRTVAQDGTGE
ncbi:MAG: NAD(P)H-dependent oxidoreductase, partial [Pseudomonadota bacterium]